MTTERTPALVERLEGEGVAHSGASASIPGELVARLEVASEGSRELDAAIWMALVECERAPWRYWAPVDENHGHEQVFPGTLYYAPHCAQVFVTPEVTTSLDAALALAERVLPGRFYQVVGPVSGLWPVMIKDSEGGGVYHIATAKAPALAMCAAILKATTAASDNLGGDEAALEQRSETLITPETNNEG